MKYWEKMRGAGQSPPGVNLTEVFWSWLGAFTGIVLVALIASVNNKVNRPFHKSITHKNVTKPTLKD